MIERSVKPGRSEETGLQNRVILFLASNLTLWSSDLNPWGLGNRCGIRDHPNLVFIVKLVCFGRKLDFFM